MSIYRSSTGRAAMRELYEATRESLPIELTDRYVSTRHGRTHVLDSGPADDPPLLVLHGANATNPLTLGWFLELASSHRLIAPDTIGQPGYSAETRPTPDGPGYGEWVVDLLDAFDIASTSAIGTSYGAGILLRLATVAPERIDRAALVVPAGFGTGPIRPLIDVGVSAIAYRYTGRDAFLDRVLDRLVTSSAPDPLTRRTVGTALREVALERSFPTATAAELDAFEAPTSLYAAAEDPFFPAATVLPRARSRLSNVERTVTLEAERHLLSRTAQGTVTAEIADSWTE